MQALVRLGCTFLYTGFFAYKLIVDYSAPRQEGGVMTVERCRVSRKPI